MFIDYFIDYHRLETNLERLVKGDKAIPRVPFILSKSTTCGVSVLWKEEIYYETDKIQKYSSTRNIMDEGGIPIGRWRGELSAEIAAELSAAFKECLIWRQPPQDILPGQDLVTWRFSIGDDSGQLSFPTDSPLVMTFSTLDMLMRRIPYWLKESNSGASVECVLELEEVDSKLFASIALENTGNEDGIVPNPLNINWNRFTYLAIETANPEELQTPGGQLVTKPLNLEIPEELDDLWDEPFLELKSSSKIKFPLKVEVDRVKFKSHYIRAVFSDYRTPSLVEPPDLPVIRGCAFSKVVQL